MCSELWDGMGSSSELEPLVSGGWIWKWRRRNGNRMRYRLGGENPNIRRGENKGRLLIPARLVTWELGRLVYVPGKEAVKEDRPGSGWREM